jgi:prepilin-type N-terminal cleavage/methylation domain-containing protein
MFSVHCPINITRSAQTPCRAMPIGRKAFTLIELLVVIAIIGLLSTIAVVSLSNARVKARDTKRLADISQLQKALELYYNVNNQYPVSGGATSPNLGWSTSNDSSWATLQGHLAPYLATLPQDPTQSATGWGADLNTFAYSYMSQGYGCPRQWYMIVYRLEKTDGQPDPGMTACDGSVFRYGGTDPSTAVKTVGYKAQ